jgi:hypothetical protein
MGKKSFGIAGFGLGVVATVWGCTSGNGTTEEAAYPAAQGGSSSMGGATTTLSVNTTGGVSVQGGSATGGSSSNTNKGGTSAGGSSSTGGAGTAGGTTARGGAGGSASGGVATGGMVATGGLWRGPTPATATAKFPFPQNRFSANCTYPANFKNEDVQSVYNAWKTDLVTAEGAGGFKRVKRPAEPGLEVNSTVSGSIGWRTPGRRWAEARRC